MDVNVLRRDLAIWVIGGIKQRSPGDDVPPYEVLTANGPVVGPRPSVLLNGGEEPPREGVRQHDCLRQDQVRGPECP